MYVIVIIIIDRELIPQHERVFMLGHGTPGGLMAVDQFTGLF
jgi:hypothetical protein